MSGYAGVNTATRRVWLHLRAFGLLIATESHRNVFTGEISVTSQVCARWSDSYLTVANDEARPR